MPHILVAADDDHIRELLTHQLTKEGYTVWTTSDGQEASHILEKAHIHLAIVDIMMPHKDGYTLCREIRELYDLPVIILTAKGELSDKEKGFLVGTDDYMVKPFEPKELLFRIKALLRRYQMVSAKNITLNRTVIDRQSHEVRCNGNTILLPLKEFELLCQLASYPGRVHSLLTDRPCVGYRL